MEKARKPFYLRWWFIGFIAIFILGLIVQQFEEEQEISNNSNNTSTVTTSSEPSKKEKVTETKSVTSAEFNVTSTAIDTAVETTLEGSNVQDASITVKDGKISFAVIVNASVDKLTAKEIGDNFVRQLSAFTDGSTPTKDYYGELYDQYDVLITVADSAENVIVQGAKVKSAKKITW